ncbi:MAG: hypothetical protein ACK4XJ_11690 [Fimbriimonadaceae bacterium]
MSLSSPRAATPESLAAELEQVVDAVVAALGGDTTPIKPGPRVPFHWPPHPLSTNYLVHASDWTGTGLFTCMDESHPAQLARTNEWFFARSPEFFSESKGASREEALEALGAATEPLFQRQWAMAEALGLDQRFQGSIRELPPIGLLRLLYCRDRDVAFDSSVEIERAAGSGLYTPALIAILNDDRHPHRYSAQWCVLDLFEDLPTFCKTQRQEMQAVHAMRDLILRSPVDYARTVYKAGVVLGGQLPGELGAPVLMECLRSPHRVGRRSAIHGLFHVAEWDAGMRETVIKALQAHALEEPDADLREFAWHIAADVEAGSVDHVIEPVFEGE